MSWWNQVSMTKFDNNKQSLVSTLCDIYDVALEKRKGIFGFRRALAEPAPIGWNWVLREFTVISPRFDFGGIWQARDQNQLTAVYLHSQMFSTKISYQCLNCLIWWVEVHQPKTPNQVTSIFTNTHHESTCVQRILPIVSKDNTCIDQRIGSDALGDYQQEVLRQ